MKIRRLSFTRGATVNLGNFNSAKFEASAEVELGDEDKLDDVFQRMRDWVTAKVAAEVKAARNERE